LSHASLERRFSSEWRRAAASRSFSAGWRLSGDFSRYPGNQSPARSRNDPGGQADCPIHPHRREPMPGSASAAARRAGQSAMDARIHRPRRRDGCPDPHPISAMNPRIHRRGVGPGCDGCPNPPRRLACRTRWIRRPTRENGLATGAHDNLLDPIAGEVIRQPRWHDNHPCRGNSPLCAWERSGSPRDHRFPGQWRGSGGSTSRSRPPAAMNPGIHRRSGRDGCPDSYPVSLLDARIHRARPAARRDELPNPSPAWGWPTGSIARKLTQTKRHRRRRRYHHETYAPEPGDCPLHRRQTRKASPR
jgi:hypothetical protein